MTNLQNAIERSKNHGQIVRVECDWDCEWMDIVEQMTADGVKWVRLEAGTYDVWTDEWRLMLTVTNMDSVRAIPSGMDH